MPRCINVETRFPAHRIGYDDPKFTGTQDPWLKRIECRSGFIAPHGGKRLIACTSGRLSKAGKLFAMVSRGDAMDGIGVPPMKVEQDGDDGINASFDVKDYKFFFELMGAKRR